ncbi:MAG: NHL repeat containing protein [uncultured bacterium]|uniref:SMP-30/Gluconolactonase/LRE-like region domain-containing protein n=1 Tax=Candidatus Wallbacteria bacterium GWC2_49_35 TaxID=1817813 RepID=A0A1F7WEE2_9BACT|nr:MAG: NHL repeat containing protein [uncultured bacterium]OGM00769.1 MAG: hypothetical protein A2008_07890 [Candidatus Wallbacteria bacterium GWC2_49_35]HBC76591.1 hypothetical protein [Candidatus Wallbacteria bacterium]
MLQGKFKLLLLCSLFTIFVTASNGVSLAGASEKEELKKVRTRIGDSAAQNQKNKFGRKLVEFETGTEENQLGLLKTHSGKIPFGMFNAPSSFVVDEKRRLYVIDCRNYRVSVFNIDDKCNFIKTINYFTDREHIAHMIDVAVTKDGSVYLGDNKNLAVVKFSSLGLPEKVFGAKEKEFSGFKQVNEIAVDKKGNLYVKDHVQQKVFQFSGDAKYTCEISIDSGLCFFSDNAHPYLEFHEDSKSWKIFAAFEDGEVEKMITEIRRESPDQNIQFTGVDSADRLYIKSFARGAIEIIRVSRDGKKIEKFAAHNQPDFDTTRFFFVDSAAGSVYAARFNGKNIQIDELEKTE